MLDRAVALARESPGEICVPAWTGGALAVSAVLAVYYVERVEGIASLRLPLALALVLAWWARALLLGRAARHAAGTLWALSSPSPRALDVLRTSIVVGLGAWLWSWLLVLGSLGGPVGVLLVTPLLALRGAFAPSWIARASCEAEAGLRAFARALGDGHDRRFAGVLVEAMLLAATLGIAVNLYALALVALLLGRSFVGLELASIETFLSPANTFVLLAIAGLATVLLEPVRAALSALRYVDARVRAEGLDLRAAIDDALAHSPRRPGAEARAALLALACALTPSLAAAQGGFPAPPMDDSLESAPLEEAAPPNDPGVMPHLALTPEDRAVEADVDAILARPEFREFADHRGDGLRDLFERLFEWLLRPRDELSGLGEPSLAGFALPGAWFFITVAVTLLLSVAAYLWLTRKKERSEARAVEVAVSGDPRDRAPSAFLDEAASLAEGGDLRAALRALYLATLVALDRRRLIAFDPHLTNWQYLRKMPRGEAREAFAQFTRVFDYKWYGLEPTTRPDYERCRSLAREIVGEEAA